MCKEVLDGGTVMDNHQVTEQLLGYVYQIRYALYHLLDQDDERAQISVEKFDDIAVSYEGKIDTLVQLKHHVKTTGDLTDASADLWRTIKVWIDVVNQDKNMIDTTHFLIITTAIAPEGTAAYYLKSDTDKRNVENAYIKLKEVAATSKNKAHKSYYQAFINLGENGCHKLLENITVIDKASNILDVENGIKNKIKYCCLPQYKNMVFERLEGWWNKKIIQALCSEEPVFMTQFQVNSFLVELGQQYAPDNLPIDIEDFSDEELNNLGAEDLLFYKQLKLICLGNRSLQLAVRDYYRAFKQRANWVRNDLLYVNELDNYERRLIDEWEHAFAEMEDDLSDYQDEITESIKVKNAKTLYKKISEKDIRIRSRCSEPFVMRGSYHILANQLKVGWHIDFYERLKHLLTEGR